MQFAILVFVLSLTTTGFFYFYDLFTEALHMLYNYNMVKKIVTDGLTLEYIFERKRIKNINIRVRRDGSVYVSAPFSAPIEKVEEFVASKAQVILAAVNDAKRDLPSITDGGHIYHLGKRYVIKLFPATHSNVILTDDTLCIYSKGNAKPIFEKWEKEKATLLISETCRKLYPLFENICPHFPDIHFRKMVSKWGVCRPRENKITFNTALVRAPMECIEYVICHEFVHFLHPDHSARFYDALSKILPDWKERKKLLSNFNSIK